MKEKRPHKSEKRRIYLMSDMVKEMRPLWKEFVVGLGYSPEQGKAFAKGYEASLQKLGSLEKMQAIGEMHGPCISAGLNAAGIDEDEAYQRFLKQQELSK